MNQFLSFKLEMAVLAARPKHPNAVFTSWEQKIEARGHMQNALSSSSVEKMPSQIGPYVHR